MRAAPGGAPDSPRGARGEEHVPSTIGDWVLPGVPYRSVRGDVTISLLVAVLGTTVALTGFGRGQAAPQAPWLAVAAVLVAAAALLVKRRLPVLTAAVCAVAIVAEAWAAGGSNLVLAFALADALYATALLGSQAERRAVAAGSVILTVTVTALVPGSADARLQMALLLIVLLGLPFFIGTGARQRWSLARSEQARGRAERERTEAIARAARAERDRAIQAERAALARELHDAVAAHLSAIALRAGAAAARAEADPALRAVRESSLAALTELRRLIGVLSAENPGEASLRVPPRLEDVDVLRADAERHGVELRLEMGLPPNALGRAASQVLMRVARESVVNAARHAPGLPLTLLVETDGGWIRLRAENPLQAHDTAPAGRGTDTRHGALATAGDRADAPLGGGLGTVIMREQAAAVGGSCEAGPEEGRWLVRARVPRQEAVS